MENDSLMKMFQTFVGRDDRTYLKDVAIQDGFAYVSDGRIALRAKLSDDCEDAIPENYPIDAMKGFLKDAESCAQWFRLDDGCVDELDGRFLGEFHDACVNNDINYCSRYKKVECPCCGKTAYYDSYECSLVEARKPKPEDDERDIDMPVRILFGEDDSAYVKFAYLHMIRSAFGRNVQFGLEDAHSENEPKVLIRDPETGALGVLCQLSLSSHIECPTILAFSLDGSATRS